MNRITYLFLCKCKKYKIKKVAIFVAHPSVRGSVDFLFGPDNSVFSDRVDFEDWPAIWKVVDDLGLKSVSGNGYQCRISDNRLEKGCYHLKDNKWKKVS